LPHIYNNNNNNNDILSLAYANVFIRSNTENQLKVQQYGAPAHRALTTDKLLRRELLDFITAHNLWVHDIPDFTPANYRTSPVLQERANQQPCEMSMSWGDVWLAVGQASIQQTVIDQAIDRQRFRLMALVRTRGEQFEYLIYM